MHKGRLEAFSDGVIAIIITIMVLEFKTPAGGSWDDLLPLLPVLGTYLLSFIYVGIYWNNHHHMFQAVKQVSGSSLWANMHLLFWLSLIPFTNAWMNHHFEAVPVAAYGFVLLMCAIAYSILQARLLAVPQNTALAHAVGGDRKGKISLLFYIVGIGAAFCNPHIGRIFYIMVAGIWFIPDRRIEKTLREKADGSAAAAVSVALPVQRSV